VREVWRRSGGVTPRLGLVELTEWYASRLGDVHDLDGFRRKPLRFDADAFVPMEERERYLSLPEAVEIRATSGPPVDRRPAATVRGSSLI
jgi:hypothetical protein